MGKPKGVSWDEKRKRILNIFYETVTSTQKTVYNLKEIENLGAKAGVIINTVKDVLQSLLDDNLVDTDKIGIGNFYWAFLSKAQQNRENRIAQLAAETETLRNERKLTQSKLEDLRTERQPSEQRQSMKEEFQALAEEAQQIDREIEELRKNQPEYVQECLDRAKRSTDEGNRYTDEVFTMLAFLKKNMHAREDDLRRQFSIPEEFDYLV